MITTLTVVRYQPFLAPFGFLSMAIHHLPWLLGLNKGFYKLMGCGKNGTFSILPDWQQFAIMTHQDLALDTIEDLDKKALHKKLYGKFIAGWLTFFGCKTYTFLLKPIEGHGTWDGKQVFGDLKPKSDYEGQIAILTRATIRLHKAHRFWKFVDGVAEKMASAEGFITSIGIGEAPWFKQATFSVWESKAHMKQFAYKMHEHADVIRRTRSEDWYSEDMFVRFKVLKGSGNLNGIPPISPSFAASGRND